ncbi:hypothetical protein LC653_40580 [Nostoc sp. CHAB 5784]|uniref:thiamine pyrophosphate-binding protein n=1 Tax=Nostoc mirabile TaxID=2907820 RepID=UPI001E34E2C0|nr:thiamine pyrophosphate-binding protein [Nostoc mirabile]MCC5669938.1 hypothetical protein [Nostoc mirabile CHAB5784]
MQLDTMISATNTVVRFLTGAETIALVLKQEGISTVFGYPGTSELALCNAIHRILNVYINGRGDKETAFMAAGACILSPTTAVGILHGARGLTNAAGALADVRRNEVGVLYIVGLPSTGSSRFLPPHGEDGLLKGMGQFAKWTYEIGTPGETDVERERYACKFVETLKTAIQKSRERPCGPILIGIPQDVLEMQWVPEWVMVREELQQNTPSQLSLTDTISHIRSHYRPLILIDDYLLKYPTARRDLCKFSNLIGAPVIQVRYQRGPMLFERISKSDVPSFVGWYEPTDPKHQRYLRETDLLITLEDRNMYPRVIGQLPPCRKIAITSDAVKTCKNEYLSEEDILVEGDVCEILQTLIRMLPKEASQGVINDANQRIDTVQVVRDAQIDPLGRSPEVALMRQTIADCLSKFFKAVPNPVLIDDSQMFGGMLAEEYDRFPSHLRVVGDHGGFVGGGISLATGLAISDRTCTVVCSLGDQGYGNAFQGLVAAGEQKTPIIYIVCNNGESVSLHKQMADIDPKGLNEGQHQSLCNAPNLNYQAVACAVGVRTSLIEWPYGEGPDATREVAQQFSQQLKYAFEVGGPWLIELKLPSLGEAWSGIWITKGLEALQVSAEVEVTDGK